LRWGDPVVRPGGLLKNEIYSKTIGESETLLVDGRGGGPFTPFPD